MKTLFALAAALVASALPTYAAPADWVGKELPDLGINFLGDAPELKGKPMVVEFWATWCPPCRVSIPHLNQVNKKFKEKGLIIIGVTDEEKATVTDFRKKMPMDYTVALDPEGKLQEKLGVTTIPQAFIIDKTGKIVWEGRPLDLGDEQIEKVLK